MFINETLKPECNCSIQIRKECETNLKLSIIFTSILLNKIFLAHTILVVSC